MSDKVALRLAGGLYLLAFPLFGGGQYLIQSGQTLPGLALVLANSAAVIAIGVLMARVIAPSSRAVSATTLWGRVLEGVILGAGAVAYVLHGGSDAGDALNLGAYHLAMLILAAAGIVLCAWLLRAKRVPALLAGFGVLGYVALATAMVLEHLGQDATAMPFLAVAGVFELAFALWLIARGFRPATA